MSSISPVSNERQARRRNILVWIVQSLLADLFVFAGGAKLMMPAATLAQATTLPAAFMRFIGVAELLGALGLVLPGILHLKTGLTRVAAGSLVVIMIGATTLTAATQGIAPAMFPFVVGTLLLIIVRGRGEEAPARRSTLSRRRASPARTTAAAA